MRIRSALVSKNLGMTRSRCRITGRKPFASPGRSGDDPMGSRRRLAGPPSAARSLSFRLWTPWSRAVTQVPVDASPGKLHRAPTPAPQPRRARIPCPDCEVASVEAGTSRVLPMRPRTQPLLWRHEGGRGLGFFFFLKPSLPGDSSRTRKPLPECTSALDRRETAAEVQLHVASDRTSATPGDGDDAGNPNPA